MINSCLNLLPYPQRKVKISGQECEKERDLHSLKANINYKGIDRDFPVEKPADTTLAKSTSASTAVRHTNIINHLIWCTEKDMSFLCGVLAKVHKLIPPVWTHRTNPIWGTLYKRSVLFKSVKAMKDEELSHIGGDQEI